MRWPLLLKVGVFNAVLVTLFGGLALALLNGAGTQFAASNTNAMRAIWSRVPNPFDLVKAMLLISPVMAVACGWYGFPAGIAGAWMLRLRRRRIHSRKRFLFESAVTGLLLGYPLTLIDEFFYPQPANALILMTSGAICGVICAAVFRKAILSAS